MNMLKNKIPFGLLSKEEQEMFRDAGVSSCEKLIINDGKCIWNQSISMFDVLSVYRLKLKEGEWYRSVISELGKDVETIVKYHFDDHSITCFESMQPMRSFYETSMIKSIRTATQAEIDSVKPKDTFVDIEIINGRFTLLDAEYRTNWNIGEESKGYCFCGFKHKGNDVIFDSLVLFKDLERKEIISRATHARFVRLT